MNRFMVCLAVVLACGLVGCGDDDKTTGISFDTPQGKVKIGESGKDGMTITTPEGTVTYSGDGTGFKGVVRDKDGKEQAMEVSTKVDLQVFENTVYPGAAPLNESAVTRLKAGGADTVTGHFLTADSKEKVVEHYKSAFPQAKVMAMGDYAHVSATTASGATFSVTIGKDEESSKTTVIVNLVKK